jgi:hypothetical protein
MIFVARLERYPRGRRGRFAKPLVGVSLARVRIPLSPPFFIWMAEPQHGLFFLFDTEGYRSGHNGAVLKTVRVQAHGGSNPSPSAILLRPVGQAVKTPPFHGGNRGSNPLRVTINEIYIFNTELWCRGLTCLPVTQEIASSNLVSSAIYFLARFERWSSS